MTLHPRLPVVVAITCLLALGGPRPTPSAAAQEQTLASRAWQDAGVRRATPTATSGRAAEAVVSASRNTLYASFGTDLPDGAAVAGVTLGLTPTVGTRNGLKVYAVPGSPYAWTETGLTYANQPPRSTTVLAVVPGPLVPGRRVTVHLPASALDHPRWDHTDLRVGTASSALAPTRIATDEHPTASFRPALRVRYSTGGATPPAAGAGNPFAGASFTPAGGPARAAADRYRASDPARAAAFDEIASQPTGSWLVGGTPEQVRGRVDSIVGAAAAAGRLPVLLAYDVMRRDGAGYSAGGAATLSDYRAWVDGLARGLGGRRAALVLEPDAVMLLPQLTGTARSERVAALAYAVDTLTAAGASVYIDAGHSRMHGAALTASLLREVGVARARGFALNVSNFQTTPEETAYGTAVSDLVGGKPFVVDTARNGRGAIPYEQDHEYWCNPPGRGLGLRPTGSTGNPRVDAYFWFKPPGESDGTCRGFPAAGTWVESYAYELARNSNP